MDVLKARQILGVGIQEDERAMKIRFRQMIRKYHPDMVGSDLIEFRRRAQEINEAYHVLKKHYQGGTAGSLSGTAPGKAWDICHLRMTRCIFASSRY